MSKGGPELLANDGTGIQSLVRVCILAVLGAQVSQMSAVSMRLCWAPRVAGRSFPGVSYVFMLWPGHSGDIPD